MTLGEPLTVESTTAVDPSEKSRAAFDVEAGTKRKTKKEEVSGTKVSRKKSVPKHNAPQRPWDQYTMGYPRFAAFISEDKDKSSTIYRRFERLAARNLLYLESELAELETKQDELDEAYQMESDEIKMTSRSWKELRRKAPYTFAQLDDEDGLKDVLDGPDLEQEDGQYQPDSQPLKLKRSGFGLDPVQKNLKTQSKYDDHTTSKQRLLLAYRIRAVLKEYYEFMKLQSDILALSKPDRRSWKATRKIFKNYDPWARTYGSEMLGEEMMSHLDNKHKHDLCVLAPPIERDRLTKLLEGRLAWIFRKRTAEGSTYYVPEQRVKIFVTLFSIVAAAAFLIGAIVGLYLVKDPSTQLFMLGAFTIGFAGALGLLTNARRQDVFAATAAYAAVLVVFISGSISNTPSPYIPSQGSNGASTSVIASTITLTSATSTTLTQFSSFQSTSTVSLVPTISTISAPSSVSTPASMTASSSNGLSGAAIGGIVGGVLGGIIIIGSIILVWRFSQRRRLSPPWPAREPATQSAIQEFGEAPKTSDLAAPQPRYPYSEVPDRSSASTIVSAQTMREMSSFNGSGMMEAVMELPSESGFGVLRA